ncbi:efflux transporter outer membrane subunit [Croceicoccus sp. Ery5]|uniref:efflux transporter outer membrane subunit n=1 Tax=Croceicoccus sp. Ery5 TaxID=1703340 RepID=UPI001E5BBBDF|nr:efflux transporter outer membrane subunit [Croceicoccus sp. Ery5]
MRVRLPALLLCTAALSACAAGPQVDPRADIAAPPAFAADLPDAGTDDDWWKGFGDPVLDTLVERGLAANLDIAAARERMRAAEALLRAERGDRLPAIDGAADIGTATGDNSRSSASAGLFLEFDPDINGRMGAEIRAAAARYAEADYLRADQRRIVAAAIARQYVEYRRTGAQLELLEESTGLQEQTLDVVTLRYEAGLSANLDVRRAAADLAQTRARRGILEIQRAQAVHALALLLGEAPGTFAPDGASGIDAIPAYRGGPALGQPVDLLRRRTDLLAAEARLQEAAANVGIEQADLRPSLTVPASIVLGGGNLGDFFDDFLASVGAALDIPLFDGGRRRAEVDAADAELGARYAEYRYAFLDALGETENALVAIDAFGQREVALSAAIEQSEAALEQSNALYREGLASLFDVLDAQRQLIGSREDLLDNMADLSGAYIALHLAAASPGPEGEGAA